MIRASRAGRRESPRWSGAEDDDSGFDVASVLTTLEGEARGDPRRGPGRVRPAYDVVSPLALGRRIRRRGSGLRRPHIGRLVEGADRVSRVRRPAVEGTEPDPTSAARGGGRVGPGAVGAPQVRLGE